MATDVQVRALAADALAANGERTDAQLVDTLAVMQVSCDAADPADRLYFALRAWELAGWGAQRPASAVVH